MRLALIVDHDLDLLNGASLQSRRFVDWLVRHGHEVELIYPSRRRLGKRNEPGVRRHTVPAFAVPSYKEYCVPLPPLALELWAKPPAVDLVHAETINPTLLLLGYWIKKRRRVPMFNVLTANIKYYAPLLLPRENLIRKSVFGLGKAIMNRYADRIEGTFVLSPGMRRALTREFYSLDPAGVFPLIRPLDPEEFAARSRPTDVYRRFPSPRGRRLVTLSRLCPTKNVGFLVRTFARHIYPRDRSLHFYVAGHGPLEGELRRQAAALGCPNIHFPGTIPYEAVPAFLAEADAFLYASPSETFGNAVCEAKHAGLPVVAVDDDGGIRAQIVDGKTGVLVGCPDEAEFARRFFELRADPVRVEAIRRQARRDVLVNNSPGKIYGNLLDIYERTIGGGRPAGPEIEGLFSYDRSFLETAGMDRADGSDSLETGLRPAFSLEAP